MGFLSDLIDVSVKTITLPIEIVKDVIDIDEVLDGESKTVKKIEEIGEDLEDLFN